MVSSGQWEIEGNAAKKCVQQAEAGQATKQINGCYSIPEQGVAQGTNTESETRECRRWRKGFLYMGNKSLNTLHIFVATRTWQATA